MYTFKNICRRAYSKYYIGVCTVISQLLVNFNPDHATKHQHFIVSHFRKTFHLFLKYGELNQYSRLPLMLFLAQIIIFLYSGPSTKSNSYLYRHFLIPCLHVLSFNAFQFLQVGWLHDSAMQLYTVTYKWTDWTLVYNSVSYMYVGTRTDSSAHDKGHINPSAINTSIF